MRTSIGTFVALAFFAFLFCFAFVMGNAVTSASGGREDADGRVPFRLRQDPAGIATLFAVWAVLAAAMTIAAFGGFSFFPFRLIPMIPMSASALLSVRETTFLENGAFVRTIFGVGNVVPWDKVSARRKGRTLEIVVDGTTMRYVTPCGNRRFAESLLKEKGLLT